MHTVRVCTARPLDLESVSRVLGDQALPVRQDDGPLAPFLTVNGRIHRPTSDFLRDLSHARPNLASNRRIASDLRGWLAYLCNDRAHHPFEDHRDPVFAANEQDFASYYRLRQYGPDDRRLSPDGWAHAAAAVKRFYEYAQRAYHHPPPFEIQGFRTPQGHTGTRVAGYRPRRRRTGSAGLPLTPAWTEQLLMGALRVDINGRQDEYRAADRDHALISFCLATGMRRHNLTHVTTYEVPPLRDLPITTTRVADLITKNDAGGDALTFTHRLVPVHHYIGGPRAEAAAESRYRPQRPLQLLDADDRGYRYQDPHAAEPDAVRTALWAHTNATTRTRLVNPDGSSPILFLNTLTGHPLSYSSLQHTVATAATFVRERINPDFPPGFRLHDLRHTYAVHLTVAIYRNVIADALRHNGANADHWVADHISAAVDLVQYSLGHASESSTRLYVQAAHRFLNIPIEQFLGLPE